MRKAARIALALCLAVLAGLAARSFLFSAQRVYGTSMEGTLQSGDIVLVDRAGYRLGNGPERGDVVLCTFPGRTGTYIKRVIGLPGEEIRFEEGRLTVDGAAVEEPWVSSPTDDLTVELGAGEYLVLGDNRADSYDSRREDMGPIRREDLLGRVRLILWPVGRLGRAV